MFTSPPVVIERAGQDRLQSDPVDRRRSSRDQRAGQLGVLEALDRPDLAAVDRDLADVENVGAGGFAVGEAVSETFLLGLSQRIDGQVCVWVEPSTMIPTRPPGIG